MLKNRIKELQEGHNMNRKTHQLLTKMMILVFMAFSFAVAQKGTMTDSRDGKKYKTVKIGDQVWMAENLNYKTKDSYCSEGKPANCKKYGRLYSWNAAMKACPMGWHLPTETEFEILVKIGGGEETAGKILKSQSGWNGDGNGTDDFGFSALPAGQCYDKSCGGIGISTSFWSSSQHASTHAYGMSMNSNSGEAYLFPSRRLKLISLGKDKLFSVRCIQESKNSHHDAETKQRKLDYGSLIDPRDGQTYKTIKIGEQVWMAENLNTATEKSYCYRNDTASCKKYGRLYSWPIAKKVCPTGWHLPKKDEFETLIETVGGAPNAQRLKSTSGWIGNKGKSDNGTDDFGFSALPAGLYSEDNDVGDYSYDIGDMTLFWSASTLDIDSAYAMTIHTGDEYSEFLFVINAESFMSSSKNVAFSVRCLQGDDSGAKKVDYGNLTDPRDGKTYKTVTIGDQTWMAENLNYKTKNSYCYKDAPANCGKYGRLYEWWDAKKACPIGWHLPTQKEFEMLIETVGGYHAGKALKSRSGWAEGIILGDDFGFSALPGGWRPFHGNWNSENTFDGAYFWSATRERHNLRNAHYMGIYEGGGHMDIEYKKDISSALSVRCLLGEHSIGDTLDSPAGLLGGSGGGIATKAKGSIKTPSERYIDMGAGGGSRSAADIMKVVRQRTPGLRHIYNKFLKKKPGFQGKVTLKFTIAPGGEIISISIASSTTGYGEFDGEFKTAVSRWKFSKVKSGNTTVTIPFEFTE